jgi:hypothetical protein
MATRPAQHPHRARVLRPRRVHVLRPVHERGLRRDRDRHVRTSRDLDDVHCGPRHDGVAGQRVGEGEAARPLRRRRIEGHVLDVAFVDTNDAILRPSGDQRRFGVCGWLRSAPNARCVVRPYVQYCSPSVVRRVESVPSCSGGSRGRARGRMPPRSESGDSTDAARIRGDSPTVQRYAAMSQRNRRSRRVSNTMTRSPSSRSKVVKPRRTGSNAVSDASDIAAASRALSNSGRYAGSSPRRPA